MVEPQFYFLSDQYYRDFPDDKLMKNKDMIDGSLHSRPCFFAFSDSKISDIYWIVPISSKYEKFKIVERNKIKRFGRCNTIRFGEVLGRNTAFLIQNMCPATIKYLTPYMDKNDLPIRIDNRVAADVIKNARDVLAIAKRGSQVIFPDVFKIYSILEQQLQLQSISEVAATQENITILTQQPTEKQIAISEAATNNKPISQPQVKLSLSERLSAAKAKANELNKQNHTENSHKNPSNINLE